MKRITILLTAIIILLSTNPILTQAKTYSDSKFVKTNAQIKNLRIITSETNTTENGEPLLYISLHGVPSKISLINLKSMKEIKELSLVHSKYTWAMESDGNGITYFGGTPDGHLYSYNAKLDEFKDLGKILLGNDTAIYGLKLVGTELFAITAYDCSLISYNILSRKVTYYGKMSIGRTTAKSFDYDPINNSFLIAAGIKADLVSFDLDTKEKKSIIQGKYVDDTNFSSIKYIDGYFFARAYPSKDVLVVKADTLEIVDTFTAESLEISDKLPNENAIIYSSKGSLHKYYYLERRSETLNIHIGNMNVLKFNNINIDNKNYLFILLDNNGVFIKLDLSNFEAKNGKLIATLQTVDYHKLYSYKNNNYILGNGFLSGGLSSYNTQTGTYEQFDGVSQSESFLEMDNKLYIGTYPRGRILEYDMSKPWLGGELGNPKELFSLEYLGQTRPAAMTGLHDTKKIFIGFYPEDGTGGGSLVSYNTISKEKIIHQNYITNHGIASLLHLDGYIYGGTTIFANGQRATDGAKFFRFKADNPSKKEMLNVNFSKRAMVTGLIEGFNRDIWGMADGYLFNYSPATKKSVVVKILPAISGRYRNGTLVKGDNGYIYGAVQGKLFRVNPISYQVEILKDSKAYNLAKDASGKIYYYDRTDIWYHQPSKIEFEELLTKVDSSFKILQKENDQLIKDFRINYSKGKINKSNYNSFTDSYNNTGSLVNILPIKYKNQYITRLHNEYKTQYDRTSYYIKVHDNLSNKIYYYNNVISKNLVNGKVNSTIVKEYDNLTRDIYSFENQIKKVYRKQNQDYLKYKKLEKLKKSHRFNRSSILSETYLSNSLVKYKAGDVTGAKNYLNKAELEIKKIPHAKLKKAQTEKYKKIKATVK